MWVDRDGFRIHARVVGDGPTVVLQTGGAGDGGMWREHVPLLSGFRLVLLDHRGRGRTDHAPMVAGHAIPEYVADLVALVSELGGGPVGFVGYSMGAQVGHALAADRPDLVATLVELGQSWAEAEPGEANDFAATVREIGMSGLVSAIEAEEGIALPGWLRQQFVDTDTEQFALSLEAVDGWRPDPAAVACPTLLVAGMEEDPERVNERVASRMPHGRAAYLERFGHVGAFLAAREQCALFVPHLRQALHR